jgi:multidrug efflux pump subunit AcrA (membrane-fusion protein)
VKVVERPETPTRPTAERRREAVPAYEPQSLKRVGAPRSVRRTARKLGLTLALLVVALAFVPWQQSVPGSGQVAVYDAMSRPQTVHAQIPGRLVAWNVQEGDVVRAGDVIARIEDIDAKFLDPRQVERLREQRGFTLQMQAENERRVDELRSQRAELASARENAIAVARQAIQQAEQRRRASERLVDQARQQLRIREEVAVQSAKERANQAEDRIAQADQSVVAARQQETTMRQRRDRIAYLKSEGLRSGQDLELAENDYVKAKTEVERAEKAREIARRDLNVGNLAQDQAGLEVRAGQAAVEKAEADLAVADREVTSARLNLSRIISETQAQLSRVAADVQGARESLAKNSGDVQKADVDLANVQARTGQQVVRAPSSGRVARLLQIGAGATVKAGDELALIVPETADRVVELYVTDNDVALLDVGRRVRVQFAGWPALQFGGFPGVAVGTFGGRIKVIDPVDDGTARYRIIVEPDRQRLPGGRLDEPWPSADRLRPGAEAAGWIMLDTVPLGFELWRQFNGFPPRIKPTPSPFGKGATKEAGKAEKAKDPTLGPIKLKSK